MTLARPGVPPAGSPWIDSHFHVVAPLAEHPMAQPRAYTPQAASLAAWRTTLGPLGFRRGVVVQPSFYGTDNTVLLRALAQAGGDLVGVAAVDASVSDAELDRLVAAGVRAVRMAYFLPGDPRGRAGFVHLTAFDALEDRLHARGLHLELFTDSVLLPQVSARLESARVPVVIDHMGRTPAAQGVGHEGHVALCKLLAQGNTWVKLSGVANISDAAPCYDDARRVHEMLVSARPDRLLWGSDWPHTKPGGNRPETGALVRLLREWTPDRGTQVRLLSRNAAELYAFPFP